LDLPALRVANVMSNSHFAAISTSFLERELIRERVSAGIRNARANEKRLGRPKRSVDRERILELQAQGHSLRHIAAKAGVGYGTVRERFLTTHNLGESRNSESRLVPTLARQFSPSLATEVKSQLLPGHRASRLHDQA
jgi:hypothetical protein